MIEQIDIDYEGPDGNWLVVNDPEGVLSDGDGPSSIASETGFERFSFQLNDDVLRQLDKAMQPWREHMAEGAAIGREFAAHAATGACTHWVAGKGPCVLRAGHDNDCLPIGGGC